MHIYLIASFVLMIMGVYTPFFARTFELASLAYAVSKYKYIKYLGTIILIIFITILFLIYHYDKFIMALKEIVYLLRIPILILSTYFLCINKFFKKKYLFLSLRIWFIYYSILLIDLATYIMFSLRPTFSYGGSTFRTFGFTNPNSLVVLTFLTIILALFYLRVFCLGKSQVRFVVMFVLLAMLIFFFTGSRGGVLGLGAVLLVELFLRSLVSVRNLKLRRKTVIYFAAGLFIILLQSMLLLSQGFDLTSYWRLNDESGGSHRLGRWINSVNLLTSPEYNFWFGWPMSNAEISKFLGGWPHNSYVKLMINYGFIFLSCFLLLMFSVLHYVRRDRLARALIIFLMFTCMTNDFVTSPIPGVFIGVAIAISNFRATNLMDKRSL